MKSGIDYFPLDVSLDDKIELIEAEFGLTGFAVIVKLFQKIYGGQGYYCEWTNEVALLFAKRIGLGGSVVSEIVSASVKRGIFSESIFQKYSVLTSAGIQKRYLEAVSRRKKIPVKKEYLLLKCAQLPENVDISSENVCTNQKNDDTFKQSKVKESKVKESKVKESKVLPRTRAEAEEQTPLQEIYDLYNEICGNKLRPVSSGMNYQRERRVMILWREYHDLSVFRKAFETAAESKFITGGWKNGGKADFDWITEQAHFVNILEGKYNDQTQSKPSGLYGSFDINEFEAMGIFDVPEVPK